MSIKDMAQAQTVRDELKGKLQTLTHEKRGYEIELGRISQYIRGTDRISGKSTRLPAREYADLTTRQRELKRLVLDVEGRMMPVKQDILKWQSYCEELRAEAIMDMNRPGEPLAAAKSLGRLIAIRDKWQRFGEDPTRVNSMRLLASAFAKELTAVIDGKVEEDAPSLGADFDHSPLA